MRYKKLTSELKAPSQCSYMSLALVNIGRIGYVNNTHYSKNSFIYEIWCLLKFCPYSVNAAGNS